MTETKAVNHRLLLKMLRHLHSLPRRHQQLLQLQHRFMGLRLAWPELRQSQASWQAMYRQLLPRQPRHLRLQGGPHMCCVWPIW